MLYKDRDHAGRILGKELKKRGLNSDYLVLGLPRGGVPVACAAAAELRADFDIFIVRKLGVPGHEELAMGALAPGPRVVLNPDIIYGLDISEEAIQEVIDRESKELARRLEHYRQHRSPLRLKGRQVVLVDDGVATGASMKAACEALKQYEVKTLVIAAPVGAQGACHELLHYADLVFCVSRPSPFFGVGQWYEDFHQVSDEEVLTLLKRSS